ncbi:MAG: MBL fold metallo-hydrolase [Deltaproteobacteria bacterium]|nr:MAG: MBL fold metallo-hydrolase [Deltaproteobacteria bacterium]
MGNLTLFDNGNHKNFLLEDFAQGGIAVQANQHLIVHGDAGMILDPGGHKIYNKVFSETRSLLGKGSLKYLFLSHQDPDIVAAANGWLMTTDAEAYASNLWLRFIPHFGLDHLVAERLHGIPDGGMRLDLGGSELLVLPAHFLHSCGNFQVYDPTSKILYSGDLGASVGIDYREVTDFDAHIPAMEGFHQRYMASNAVMAAWARMVRPLDIEIIAPQHGAVFKGKEQVGRFIDWCEALECGVDLIVPEFTIPDR